MRVLRQKVNWAFHGWCGYQTFWIVILKVFFFLCPGCFWRAQTLDLLIGYVKSASAALHFIVAVDGGSDENEDDDDDAVSRKMP